MSGQAKPSPSFTRSFGSRQDSLDAPAADSASGANLTPGGGGPDTGRRVSFANQHRPSFARWRRPPDDEERALAGSPALTITERPAVPNPLTNAAETDATPLPKLSMVVLSITMLGEFLSANVSTPFLLFMVKGFGEFPDEAEAAYMTGVLVSMFFLTQFITSLLWATVAQRYGQRAVLSVSLVGTACTCVIFGTATSFKEAAAIRLLQGIFAGAVGVARGCVASVTDSSNEGRAYAILGFSWGFGGVAGAVIGGSFESPANKWPGVFDTPFFRHYPYILPTAIASSITLTGAFLSLFLAPDGGPRGRSIGLEGPEKALNVAAPALVEDEDISPPPSPLLEATGRHQKGLYGSLRKKVSGYFGKNVEGQVDITGETLPVPLSGTPARGHASPNADTPQRATGDGSAYGYSTSALYRNRLASGSSARRGSIAASLANRRGTATGPRPSFVADNPDLSFAQRLVLANENAVTNIADLWVAAAINVDNEEVFEDDSVDGGDDILGGLRDGTSPGEVFESTPVDTPGSETSIRFGRLPVAGQTTPTRESSSRRIGKRPSNLGLGDVRTPRFSTSSARRPSGVNPRFPGRHASGVLGQPVLVSPDERRFSNAMPAIFSNPGLKTPPAVLEAQSQWQHLSAASPSAQALATSPSGGDLAPIAESRRASTITTGEDDEVVSEKAPSVMSVLPLMIIFQYGVLALHSTTHDQLFYSYLVSDYKNGGLNLNPGHFSQLIALMCLCQIVFQFYFYPNLGPPRGRFSHLAMFRVGSTLFIPAYLAVILFRAFASDESEGNVVVMGGLAIATAVRYCGTTFSYTAVSILLNYMTPPEAIGFANGIAQSIVSAARFAGPICGGLLWSVSVEGNPNGYPIGFLVVAGTCTLSIMTSFLIR